MCVSGWRSSIRMWEVDSTIVIRTRTKVHTSFSWPGRGSETACSSSDCSHNWLVAQRYRINPFLPEIIRSGYLSGYTIEYELPWYIIHDRVDWWCENEGGSKRRRRHLPNFAILDGFAFLHLRYVVWTAWFPGSRQNLCRSGDRWEAQDQTCGCQLSFCGKVSSLVKGWAKSYLLYGWPLLRWESEAALKVIILSTWISWQGRNVELLMFCREVWGDLYMTRAWASDSWIDIHLPLSEDTHLSERPIASRTGLAATLEFSSGHRSRGVSFAMRMFVATPTASSAG